MKPNKGMLLFTLLLIVMTTVCKYFLGATEWSGFSPVIAIALFAGFMIKDKKTAFILPLVALFLSDVVIHFLYTQNWFDYPGFYGGQWKNYLLLLSVTLIGFIVKGKSNISVAGGAVAAPTLYFLLSNLMVWYYNEVSYSRSFDGLMNCYTAASPFYRNSLIATIIFLPVIMIAYNYLIRHKTQVSLA